MPKALLVGVAGFENKANHKFLSEITSPPNDVALISETLLKTGFITDKNDIRSLVNAKATYGKIVEELKDLSVFCEDHPNAPIFIYFACHGLVDHHGKDYTVFLLPYDAEVEESYCAKGISIRQLDQLFEQILNRSQTAMFVDACHSGAFRGPTLGRAENVNVLLSCRAHQKAGESENGLFARCLIEALGGCGGSGPSGQVTFWQACRYVEPALSELATKVGHEQSVSFFLHGPGNMAVGRDMTDEIFETMQKDPVLSTRPHVLRRARGAAKWPKQAATGE
jgi:hypothetical protein